MLDAERERLKTLDEDEAIRGTQAATEVTQPFDTSTDDEGSWAKRLTVAQTVIARAGLGEVREVTIVQSNLPESMTAPPIAVPLPQKYFVSE